MLMLSGCGCSAVVNLDSNINWRRRRRRRRIPGMYSEFLGSSSAVEVSKAPREQCILSAMFCQYFNRRRDGERGEGRGERAEGRGGRGEGRGERGEGEGEERGEMTNLKLFHLQQYFLVITKENILGHHPLKIHRKTLNVCN